MLFAPAQVHAQQHLGPVLGLGAAGACLDIEEGIVGIEFTGEHAAEFEFGNALVERVDIGRYRIDRVFIALFDGHFEQVGAVAQASGELIHVEHDALEQCAFLTQRLGALLIVPDVRVFEFAQDLGQAFFLAFVVKDTP